MFSRSSVPPVPKYSSRSYALSRCWRHVCFVAAKASMFEVKSNALPSGATVIAAFQAASDFAKRPNESSSTSGVAGT